MGALQSRHAAARLFLPGSQALIKFVRTTVFAERANELTGYDVNEVGHVRWVN